ncbi:MAG: VanZ family protein [Phycisphaerales bacterium]|nr:VanZ family protein [Phycisphaerales bacterium]
MPSSTPYRIIFIRVFFIMYTLTLLTATHWPGLSVKGPFSRTDLIIHTGAFGFWTIVFGMSGWVRSSCCIRRQALMVGLIGIGFGLGDEITQPLFSRVFDWLDVAANMTGAILASLVLLFFWYRKNGNQCSIAPDSLAQPPADARS